MKAKELKLLRKTIGKANNKLLENELLAGIPQSALNISIVTSTKSTSPTESQPGGHAALPLELTCCLSKSLSNDRFQEIFNLFEQNMRKLYENSSWGLDLEQKINELKHAAARFLLVVDKATNLLVAFVHFRFEYDDDERPTCAVLYVYEIQVQSLYQGKGIGRNLMNIIEAIGQKEDMSKVLLTVFTSNQGSIKFYESLGYVVDDTSPSKVGQAQDYEILSLNLPKREGKKEKDRP